jgi:hypothetical protein
VIVSLGHKTDGTATGSAGTVSWKLGETGKMLVVMYSLPFNFDFYSNWLGIGIFKEEDTSEYFNKMYYESEIDFKRKEFYYDTDAVVFDDGTFTVNATMGTTHKSEIHIYLKSMLC